ncbi:MAG: AmmeMemoRadiSam system radical SAM enzyme [Candidatus Hydrothermarchaeales archaeon]
MMEREAMLWEPLEGKKVKCSLCAKRCTIKEGKRGFCMVRENRDGSLYTLNYGLVSSVASDPIEKKPLYHFYPGTTVFSLGTVSCNFRCKQCQNYSISQTALEEARGYLKEYSPEKTVELAKDYGCSGIAWTYNEPTIWFEYTYDSAKLAKENGLYTVYVTNGYFTGEALDTIAPYLDAMNVDVKSFRKDFYKDISKGRLGPVMESVERAVKKGIHVELTYLVIPTLNDSDEEIDDFIDWAAGVDVDIPVHFSRFHPEYKLMDLPPTPIETLERARDKGLEKLHYVYAGNVMGHEGENTFCYNCGELVIRRWGFIIREMKLTRENKCPSCGSEIKIIR